MRIRKSTIDLDQNEWDILNNAIDTLIQSGKWYILYHYHAERGANHRMHGSMSGEVGYDRFLYWHRAYVIVCENALREIDKTITIPYWDWLKSNTVPQQLNHIPMRGMIRNTGVIDFTDTQEINRIMN